MPDLSVSFWVLLMRAISAVVVFALHGFLLAGCAYLLGDRGPKYDGRLTLNPFAHVDVFGLVAAATARFGWIKPMRIDADQLRFGRLGLVICWLGSLAATLLVVRLLLLLQPLATAWAPTSASLGLFGWFGHFSDMAVWFVIFNLLPLPPLTGGLLLAAVAPALYRVAIDKVIWISVALAAIMVFTQGQGLHLALRPLASLLAP